MDSLSVFVEYLNTYSGLDTSTGFNQHGDWVNFRKNSFLLRNTFRGVDTLHPHFSFNEPPTYLELGGDLEESRIKLAHSLEYLGLREVTSDLKRNMERLEWITNNFSDITNRYKKSDPKVQLKTKNKGWGIHPLTKEISTYFTGSSLSLDPKKTKGRTQNIYIKLQGTDNLIPFLAFSLSAQYMSVVISEYEVEKKRIYLDNDNKIGVQHLLNTLFEVSLSNLNSLIKTYRSEMTTLETILNIIS